MAKMKVLNCRGILESAENNRLKEIFPKLNINQDFFHFANSDKIFHPKDGFWEINKEQYVFKGAIKGAQK